MSNGRDSRRMEIAFQAPIVSKVFVLLVLSIIGGSFLRPATLYARCGGTERWIVKVGTDPQADRVDINNIIPISIKRLNELPSLRDTVPWGDNKTRLEEETVVYKVSGRLVLFKCEESDRHSGGWRAGCTRRLSRSRIKRMWKSGPLRQWSETMMAGR